MRIAAMALVFIAGLINFVPVTGVFSVERLQALYGVAIDDPNLAIMMRHRALLLGMVGALLMASAFHAPFRGVALAMGLLSMLSFVVLAWLVGAANPELERVVLFDLFALAALIGGNLLGYFSDEFVDDEE